MAIVDYRKNEPEIRKSYFKDWVYMFSKYKMWGGMIYLYFPEFCKKLNLTKEQRLWWAFLNSACENPNTTFALAKYFPDIPRTASEIERFRKFHADNQSRIAYDTDRRYFRTKLVSEFEQYLGLLDGKTQEEFFYETLYDKDPKKYYNNVHDALSSIKGWGRVTTWSAMEFYKILGEFEYEWDSFHMNDLKGSKSQRNGYLKMIGRDDLVWDKRQANGVESHSKELMAEIEIGAMETVEWLREEFKDEDFLYMIGPETLETAFCSFKNSFYGRRYTNVYADMSYFRIKKAEEDFPEVDFSIFWEVRGENLPDHFLLEKNPDDTLHETKNPSKCAHGIELKVTGIPYNMHYDFPEKYKPLEDYDV